MSKEKAMKTLYKFAEKYLLPLLLGAVVMNVIFKTYMVDYKVVSILYVLYETLLFALFELIKPKRIFRGFVYILMFIGVSFLGVKLIQRGSYDTGTAFIDWFYLNSQDVGEVDQYLYTVFIVLGFFLISILYYFTVYRYRTFGVMLIILFPFVIYGKRDDQISQLSITIMLTLFLALMVHESLISDDVKKNTIINSSYVIGVSVFVTFVGALVMVIPKPEVKSELENDTGFFNFRLDSESMSYEVLNDVSSPRYGSEPTGEILFRMETDGAEDVVYLRRQAFDRFEDNQWVLDDDFYVYTDDYSYIYTDEYNGDNELNSAEYVHDLMEDLAKTGRYEEYGLTSELFNENQYSLRSSVREYSGNFSPNYVPAPLMAEMSDSQNFYNDLHGEIYFTGGRRGTTGFQVNFSYVIAGEPEMEYAKSIPFSWDEFLVIANEAYINGDITYSQLYNFNNIYNYYTFSDEISPQVEQLAHEITDKYDSDYEKAQAIVEYFENNGYSYDLYYEPDDDSIEYFLFESKIGNCTCYATSMALMARAVGLPSRYTEGFSAYELDENGNFIIRDLHAHAFVEVYLPGVGWTTFDPTVSGYMTDGSYDDSTGFLAKFLEYFSRIILFLGVIFVLIFIVFLDRIMEFIFRISLKFKPQSKKVIMLYVRVVKLLEISSKEKLKGCTPNEIEEFALNKYSADISKICKSFEKTCFGGYDVTAEQFEEIYQIYKQNWKALCGKINKRGSLK